VDLARVATTLDSVDPEPSTPKPTAPKPAAPPPADGAAGKEIRRGLLAVVMGTRPGLERFLLASVPALTLGAIGMAVFGRVVGLAVALVTVVVVVLATRRLGEG
jgi:hypothetical protein